MGEYQIPPLFEKSSLLAESIRHPRLVCLTLDQFAGVMKSIADFLPPSDSNQSPVACFADKIKAGVNDGSNFIYLWNSDIFGSLADFQPPTAETIDNQSPSFFDLLKSSNGLPSAFALLKEHLQAQIIGGSLLTRQQNALPPEFRLMMARSDSKDAVEKFANNGGIFLFLKTKKTPKVVLNIIYRLSKITNRRLDWLDDWINHLSQKVNGGQPKEFAVERHFGKLNPEEEETVSRSLEELSNLMKYFYHIYPITPEGEIDQSLCQKLNDGVQDWENRYAEILIKKDDIEAEIEATKITLLFSPLIYLILAKVLAHESTTLGQAADGDIITYLINILRNPTILRSLPPWMADLASLWAEVSPFINREQRLKDRIAQFISYSLGNYKLSTLSSLLLTPLGNSGVEYLHQLEADQSAGLLFGANPFIIALIMTLQSSIQELKLCKQLKENQVAGFAASSSPALFAKALKKTFFHPARFALLLAGVTGIGEGILMGYNHLLSDPFWLTFVGEINEALVASILLSGYTKYELIKYQWEIQRQLKNQSSS